MQRLLKLAKPITLAVVLAIAVLPSLANPFDDGKAAGKANASGAWFAGGCLLGLVGVAGAYLIVPDPPAEELMGKSASEAADFTAGYKDGIRGADTRYAVNGCVTTVAIGIAAGCVLSIAAASSTSSSE